MNRARVALEEPQSAGGPIGRKRRRGIQQKEKDQDVLKLSFEDDLRVKWIPPEEWLKKLRPLKPGETIGSLIAERKKRSGK